MNARWWVSWYEYQRQYGDESWELDALEPMVMVDLIRDEVGKRYNMNIGRRVMNQERDQENDLDKIIRNWDSVSKFVKGLS